MNYKLVRFALLALCAVCIVAEGCSKSGSSGSRAAALPTGSGPGAGTGTGSGTGSGTSTGTGTNPGNVTADEQAVFEMINDARATAGVGPLEWCDGLYACAKAHSNDMCVRGFFSHTNPEGEDPSDRGRLGHAGSYTFTPIVSYPYVRINENIAYGYSTPAEVMNAWMNSPGHRANILNSGSTHIGVGNCDQCGSHWTLNFGNRW